MDAYSKPQYYSTRHRIELGVEKLQVPWVSTMHKIILGSMLLAMCVTSSLFGKENEVIDSFKDLLTHKQSLKRVTWREFYTADPQNISYYTGATDGTNFFIRRHLPSENLDTLLSPTNKMQFPYFFGRVGQKWWEIAGLNVYETEAAESPVATIGKGGESILARMLTMGLIGTEPGSFKWQGNQFRAKRGGGPKPTKIEIHNKRSGQVTYGDLENVAGELYVSNGLPARIDIEGKTIYYDYDLTNKSLPMGVPSTITVCGRGHPHSDMVGQASVLDYDIGYPLASSFFEPYGHIESNYFTINKSSDTSISPQVLAKGKATFRYAATFGAIILTTVLLVGFIAFRSRRKSTT